MATGSACGSAADGAAAAAGVPGPLGGADAPSLAMLKPLLDAMTRVTAPDGGAHAAGAADAQTSGAAAVPPADLVDTGHPERAAPVATVAAATMLPFGDLGAVLDSLMDTVQLIRTGSHSADGVAAAGGAAVAAAPSGDVRQQLAGLGAQLTQLQSHMAGGQPAASSHGAAPVGRSAAISRALQAQHAAAQQGSVRTAADVDTTLLSEAVSNALQTRAAPSVATAAVLGGPPDRPGPPRGAAAEPPAPRSWPSAPPPRPPLGAPPPEQQPLTTSQRDPVLAVRAATPLPVPPAEGQRWRPSSAPLSVHAMPAPPPPQVVPLATAPERRCGASAAPPPQVNMAARPTPARHSVPPAPRHAQPAASLQGGPQGAKPGVHPTQTPHHAQ
jgi:hypothetical protein